MSIPRLAMFFVVTSVAVATAQRPHASVREFSTSIPTYPFSDPNPIPVVGRIYPYFRFDGFTNTAVPQSWKVVELENAYLKVRILPEIGGKIWSAIEKSTGKSFIYDNHVVKFRDIAMRGPWTSGGIEANYGIIGHTPNVATPVDYVTHANADGSVTCTIGALDLLTRTQWRLEITLSADKAYFTTSSLWHNATPYPQPYYAWMNAAIPVAGDLEYVYDGNRFLGHNGELGDWPVNRTNGKQISWYRNNDFGGYKSYHVFGAYTDFFGAYWHDQKFGMARYAPHDEKPGKKLWIWGLSHQGMIWQQLLTDADGQYTEVQSGRLFNQTSDASTSTPFKHRDFAPYGTDRWTEYWLPVKGTDGFVAANQWGALNVQSGPRGVVISFSPVQRIADTLTVYDGDRVVYAKRLLLRPLQTFTDTTPALVDPARLRVMLGRHKLEYLADTASRNLSRPVEPVTEFDWTSANGRTLAAQEKVRERDYAGAERELAAALHADSSFVPALTEMASLLVRRNDPVDAVPFVRRALRIDTYDPAANFTFGLVSRLLGHAADARDGFDIASQSVEYRSAAYTELARTYLRQGDLVRAGDYATKAIDYNRNDIDALQLRALAARLRRDRVAAKAELRALSELDPLNHFVRVERWLWSPTEGARRNVLALIRNEMPAETLLELAIWYQGAGQTRAADQVLSLSPPQPEILYWRAFLHHRLGDGDSLQLLAHANAASPRLAFPFRAESDDVLSWAVSNSPAGWTAVYFRALLRWSLGDSSWAQKSLETPVDDSIRFAPFFVARAELARTTNPTRSLADLRRAAALEPSEWRYGRLLIERALADSDFANAAQIAATYHARFPTNSVLGILHARTLLRIGKSEEARQLLDRIEVLPYEGSGAAHALYREANLTVATERLRANDGAGALLLIGKAREWPERLGAGKPYAADVDERREDWLEGLAHLRLGHRAEAARLLRPLLEPLRI